MRSSLPTYFACADAKADFALEHTVEAVLTASQPSTLIYLTTPPAQESTFDEQQQGLYEMDDPFPSGLHTDLKRDLRARQNDGNKNMQDGLPLFEKWQFLSPGKSIRSFVDTPARALALMLSWYRYLHGPHGLAASVSHPLRRRKCHCELGSVLHGLLKGDGASEGQAAMISDRGEISSRGRTYALQQLWGRVSWEKGYV